MRGEQGAEENQLAILLQTGVFKLVFKEQNKRGRGRGKGVLFLSKHTEGGKRGPGRREGNSKGREHEYSTKVLFCFYLEENSLNKTELKPERHRL